MIDNFLDGGLGCGLGTLPIRTSLVPPLHRCIAVNLFPNQQTPPIIAFQKRKAGLLLGCAGLALFVLASLCP